MTDDDYGRLIYLVLLGAVVGGYFLVSQRDRIGEALRGAMLWGIIFVGVIIGYGLWNDLSQTVMPRQTVLTEQGRIELPRQSDGHYYMTLNVGETPVNFIVDTGASNVVLSKQDAARVGISEDELFFTGRASTANGMVRTARVTLDDVTLGGIDEGSVRAYVNDGELETSLLGMDYLERFERIEINRGTLILER
ncbi:aspartyl protease family protein [Litoreibacter ponti]|uniref:Aspartyl protease family protein n=1 Tax=Litoreibacter ponti TaxID=1510457 RepID=A0A2T6BI14_9RHOB|nr:TIGR02281 family clan AA aspartic protease [Litoreibacter ponti]PTX55699.1 aspartyl protease family protein [Litoreibacter ponti]